MYQDEESAGLEYATFEKEDICVFNDHLISSFFVC